MGGVDRAELLDALQWISPELPFNDWLAVGMALHHEGCDFADFDGWSAADSRPGQYSQRGCMAHWRTFRENGEQVTGKTIFKMAYDAGWPGPKRGGRAFGWNDAVTTADEPARRIRLEGAALTGVPDGEPESAAAEVLEYLRALFRPDERVGLNVQRDSVMLDSDGKWKPGGRGSYTRTCGQLCASIEKHRDDLGAALGDPEPDAGAWVRVNPLDGQGVGDANVAAYRYALVECDGMELEKQLALIHELRLPCAAITTSGGKSVHAVVHVDAAGKDEYRRRVVELYRYCRENGLAVDEQNRNPSRLTRLPGYRRGDRWQRLIETGRGFQSWAEWQEWRTGLPPIGSFATLSHAPSPAPELMHGILRRGQKLMLTGPSKAGKSFALIQLAVAFARGWDWMGSRCERGRVLYVNFEIGEESFNQRVLDVYQAMKRAHGESVAGMDGLDILHELDLLDPWSLRGYSAPLDAIEPLLLRQIEKTPGGYSAIILDPIYKLLTGDENSASDMAKLCNSFDRIATKTGASILYAHHHAKGTAGSREPIDRGSGSGVFARDPDALLDMCPINCEEGQLEALGAEGAYRVEMTLREFRSPKPLDVLWRWPVHEVTGELGGCKVAGQNMTTKESTRRAADAHSSKRATQWAERTALTATCIDELRAAGLAATVANIGMQLQFHRAEAERLGVTAERLQRWTTPSEGRAGGKAALFGYIKGPDGGLVLK